ncbi:MAG: hypothetical protein V3V08_15595 [Nannocystaceae bacterium]
MRGPILGSLVRRPGVLRRIWGPLCGIILMGCRAPSPRSPEALRDAYAEAIRHNDPDAAYDLLSPGAQAHTERAAFGARWAKQQRELRATLGDIESLDEPLRRPLLRGRTAHPSGRVIHWQHADGRYWVVAGLPGPPDLSSPEHAVRALIDILRADDHSALEGVMTEELAQQRADRWAVLADALEAALAKPGAVERSESRDRAVLRYAPGRRVVLAHDGAQWRVQALQ